MGLPMEPRWRRDISRLLLVLSLALGSLAACGDDSNGSDDATPAEQGSSGARPTSLDLTLTEGALEGVPDELPSGLVEIVVDDRTEGAGGEVNLTRVEPGTGTEEFVNGLSLLFGGGAFPEYFLDNAGARERATALVEPGEYIVWFDEASELDRESTAEDIVTARLTVTDGEDVAELPAADGTITSTDYEFTLDVSPGDSTVNFVNDSTEQFHHVELVDFGTNDRQAVEDNLPAILQAEDPSALPPGIEGSEIDFDFGGSGVFGPGSAGSFDVTFEEGSTYAALCFLQDREGGGPHAEEHQMYEVFEVGAS